MANTLTLARVLLIFVVIGVWSRDRVVENVWLDLAMVPMLAWPYLRSTPEIGTKAHLTVDSLVYITTAIALIRAIPVLWDGRRYLAA